MLVLKGVVFLNKFYVAPDYRYHCCNIFCKRVLVQGAYYCSRNLALSPSYSLADVGLGEGMVAIDRTPTFSPAV